MSRHFQPDRVGLDRYVIDDPEAQEDITTDVTPGEVPTHYDNQYIAKNLVRCALCPQHQLHLHGYTGVFSDGRRALIGIDCGSRHFGDFRQATLRRQLRDDTERRLRTDLLAQARAGLPIVIEALRSRWAPLEYETATFVSHLPRILRSDAERHMPDGRDYVLGRMETQMKRDPDGIERPREVFIETGRVRELRAAWEDRSRLREALTLAQALASSAERMERAGKVMEDGLTEQRRVLLERLREGIAWHERVRVLLEPQNLIAYGQAARKHGSRSRIEVKERGDGWVLRTRPEDSEWLTHRPPSMAEIPTEAALVAPLLGTT